jgi:hypothetical protein
LRGKSLHLGNIRQHARSGIHTRACAAAAANGALPIAAPTADTFDEAWASAAKGKTVASRKSRSLEWCIAEAIRDADRDFLRRAKAIAVLLDKRNSRLLVKFQACDDDLVVRFGVLALLRNAGKSAPQIAAAVHQSVQCVCTRRLHHSGCNALQPYAAAQRGIVDETLVQHILGHVVFCVSDDDTATQPAGHMLHRNSERDALAEKLPNLRAVIHDRAHSSRHLKEHSFAADPVLHSLLQAAVLDSQTLRADLLAVVTDMSFAAQRFDSLQKPLGRIVLNLEALVRYCHLVIRDRGAGSERGEAAWPSSIL